MKSKEMTEDEVREVMREASIATAIAELKAEADADRLPEWAADALAAILARRNERGGHGHPRK